MKLKDMLLTADALLIMNRFGNVKYYDESNSEKLTAQFKEDTVKCFEYKRIMGVNTLIVKLAHWG